MWFRKRQFRVRQNNSRCGSCSGRLKEVKTPNLEANKHPTTRAGSSTQKFRGSPCAPSASGDAPTSQDASPRRCTRQNPSSNPGPCWGLAPAQREASAAWMPAAVCACASTSPQRLAPAPPRGQPQFSFHFLSPHITSSCGRGVLLPGSSVRHWESRHVPSGSGAPRGPCLLLTLWGQGRLLADQSRGACRLQTWNARSASLPPARRGRPATPGRRSWQGRRSGTSCVVEGPARSWRAFADAGRVETGRRGVPARGGGRLPAREAAWAPLGLRVRRDLPLVAGRGGNARGGADSISAWGGNWTLRSGPQGRRRRREQVRPPLVDARPGGRGRCGPFGAELPGVAARVVEVYAVRELAVVAFCFVLLEN